MEEVIDLLMQYAHGNPETIKKKLQNYVDAGATQLVIYPCNPGEDYKPDSALSVEWHWEPRSPFLILPINKTLRRINMCS